MSLQTQLNTEGYILFKNVIPLEKIEWAKSAIKGNKVNYTIFLAFIYDVMLKEMNQQLKWKAVHTKFRVSDNNNSTDASTFHRDVICHNPNYTSLPIYTCLAYFDNTVMEIVPQSHLKLFMTVPEAISNYSSKLKLQVGPGDILLFHSNLLHRGLFTEGLKHRRLIQVFEVYPNSDLYERYHKQILHMSNPVATSYNIMVTLSKIPIIIDLLNWLGYLNAATGYGYKYRPLEKYKLNHFSYISSEGGAKRLKITTNTYGDGTDEGTNISSWQEINTYIMKSDEDTLVDKQLRTNLIYEQYTRQYMCYVLIIVLFILIIILLVYYYRVCKNCHNMK